MVLGLVLAALVVGYVLRHLLAARSRKDFCRGDCVTLALRLHPGSRNKDWKHGYARLDHDAAYWRGELRVGAGPSLKLDRGSVVLRDRRTVGPGDPTRLSEGCEVVSVRYQGEPVELAVPANELDRLLAWLGAA